MSDIDDLAELCADAFSGADLAYNEHHKLAEDILAAGFHRDRTITTYAELDNLASGSVVLTESGTAWQRSSSPYVTADRVWLVTGDTIYHPTHAIMLPVIVLHEGASDE